MQFNFLDHLSLSVKDFISLYKPCLDVTLNPKQAHIFETTKPVSEQERALCHAEPVPQAGRGTHCSIPLLLELYFVGPLPVLPKHLIPPHCIPISPLYIPDASSCPEMFSKSLKQENTDKHPGGTSLVTRTGEKFFVFSMQAVPAQETIGANCTFCSTCQCTEPQHRF